MEEGDKGGRHWKKTQAGNIGAGGQADPCPSCRGYAKSLTLWQCVQPASESPPQQREARLG